MSDSISIRLHSNKILVLTTPNECPLCAKSVYIDTTVAYYQLYENKIVQVVYQCPNRECRQYFIGYYEPGECKTEDVPYGTHRAKFIEFRPSNSHPPHFSPENSHLSPAFMPLYSEALTAKQHSLYQIAGLGFGKAFEILVKDYAIQNASSLEEKTIQKESVLSLVKEYIRDERTVQMAEKVLSGANEFQHERKWEPQDMEDLITLINVTRHYILLDIMEQGYKERSKDERVHSYA